MITEKILEIKSDDLPKLLGPLDKNLKIIKSFYNINLYINSNTEITIKGENKEEVNTASNVIENMIQIIEKKDELSEQKILYLIQIGNKNNTYNYKELLNEKIISTINGKPIKPKTINQKHYIDMIEQNDITFGIGPAGTGKTYLAVAQAVKAFKNREVERIILTRPAIEAGESLGFLPGDMQDKVDPYLRPLYDALFEIMGMESFLKNVEKQLIEVAPLAYMRGRTLNNSFIILDEAQNTTNEQIKMFLTRLGYGSKAIITGDITQTDLPKSKSSGLKTIQFILNDIDQIGFMHFDKTDVVRHKLVQNIITAYEDYEMKHNS